MLNRSERGAAAVIVAASLILLMGVAAIALDLGLGYSERRQAQSAADFGALAAVQFSGNNTVPTACVGQTGDDLAACRGALEAMRVVSENLPGEVLDWTTCTDPDAARAGLYPLVPVVNGSAIDCIRFTPTTQGARVVDPTFEQETTFGRVLGVDAILISAEAEARGELVANLFVLPFGVPANAGGSFECLKTGPNPDWGVCKDLPTNGNFGYLGIPLYGNTTIGTTSDRCNPNNDSLVSNMVRGADHPIGVHRTGSPTSTDPALNDDNGPDTASRRHVCPVFGSNANEIPQASGVITGAFEDGMIWGYGATDRGRLWGSQPIRNGGGSNPPTRVNNRPLWSYLSSSACNGIPGVIGSVDDTTEMIACLDAWRAGSVSGVLFSSNIRNDSRYAFAPKLWTSFSSASDYLVRSIVPIYLHTSYFRCSSAGGSGTCALIHTPGVADIGTCPVVPVPATGSEPPDQTCGIPGKGNDGLNAITAFILEPGMLPASALAPTQSDGSKIDIALTR